MNEEDEYDETDAEEYVDTTDYERLEEIKDNISSLLHEYVRVLRADITNDGDDPIIRAWALPFEWTNIQLEQSNIGARDFMAPIEQTISASAGLGSFMVHRLG